MTAHLHIPHATAVRIGDFLDVLGDWLIAIAFAVVVIAAAIGLGFVAVLSLLDLLGSNR